MAADKQTLTITVHPTDAELAQEARLARAQRLIDEVVREKAESQR